MNIEDRVYLQRPGMTMDKFIEYKRRKATMLSEENFVNKESFIDNYIIAKVAMRDRFILYPQQYELFVNSAVKDVDKKIDELITSLEK